MAAVYAALLGREPEPDGLRGWGEQLERGLGVAGLLEAVVASPECAARLASGRGGAVRWRAAADGSMELTVQLDPQLGLPPLWLSGPLLDRSVMAGLAAARGIWEPTVTRLVLVALRPGDTFLDVGANLGYFTIVGAARVGPSGRVVAVEALDGTRRRLAANLDDNRLTNVDLVGVGLWSGPMRGHAEDVDAQSLGWARVVPADSSAGHLKGQAVRGAALDDLVAAGEVALPACALAKLDIEGSETQALRGMRATLGRLRPPLLIELNNHALQLQRSSGAELLQLLTELRYAVQALPEAGQEWAFAGFPGAEPWPGVRTRLIGGHGRLLEVSRHLDAASPPADGLELVAIPEPAVPTR